MTRKFGKTIRKRKAEVVLVDIFLESVDISTFGLNIDRKQTFVYHRDLIPPLSETELE